MAKIPEVAAYTDLTRSLVSGGLRLMHQGKVRVTYALSDPTFLLQVATDRISCYDIILPSLIPRKGAVLTAMTVFWLTKILGSYRNHLVAYGPQVDPYLPSQLRGHADLHSRGLVVKKLQMLPVECVVRGYLTGSGWKDYKKTGKVCGHKLPDGLHDGSKLPEPIFTPATKAQSGHDENISAFDVRREYGYVFERTSLEVYALCAKWAISRGVIVADTKLEFGVRCEIADEVVTPDSSRFWDRSAWQASSEHEKSPTGMDKQYVRDYLTFIKTPFGCSFDKLDPENPEHLDWVSNSVSLPEGVVAQTSVIYQEAVERIMDEPLENFQIGHMGLAF